MIPVVGKWDGLGITLMRVRLGIKKSKVRFWNVRGWSEGDGGQMERRVQEHDMRAEMIGYYKPDVFKMR